MSSDRIRVLFVCLGNICRSPLAEGAFRMHVESHSLGHIIHVDSAGTSGYHVGEAPDERSRAVAAKHGVDISRQRARQFIKKDLLDFDFVIAMDESNLRNINHLNSSEHRAQTSLMLSELAEGTTDVPDPYYGGTDGFDLVWSMVERACATLLERIVKER